MGFFEKLDPDDEKIYQLMRANDIQAFKYIFFLDVSLWYSIGLEFLRSEQTTEDLIVKLYVESWHWRRETPSLSEFKQRLYKLFKERTLQYFKSNIESLVNLPVGKKQINEDKAVYLFQRILVETGRAQDCK